MHELSRSVQAIVENLQAWAYREIGRDPGEVPGIIDQLKYKKRRDAYRDEPWAIPTVEIDEVDRPDADRLYERWRTTAYQDPVILRGVASEFDNIARAAAAVFPDAAITSGSPLLATVPLGLLNGFVFKDTHGRHAIIIEEGMRFAPLWLAKEIGDHLFAEEAGRIHVYSDPDSLNQRFAGDWSWCDKLLAGYLTDASNPGIIQPTEENARAALSGPGAQLYTAIADGFKAFVVAHEYAHCLNRHIDQRGANWDKARIMRNGQQLGDAMRRGIEKYPAHPLPSIRQLHAFIYEHAMEMDADLTAMILVIESFRAGDDKPTVWTFLRLVGAIAFFWHIEMTERVLRTFDLGSKWFEDELYNVDLVVQGLYYRATHPAPLERLWAVIQGLSERYEHNAFLGQLATAATGCVSSIFSKAWEVSRDVVFFAIEDRRLTLDSKWVREIPLSAPQIGARCVGAK